MTPEDIIDSIAFLKQVSYQLTFQTRVKMDHRPRTLEWYASITLPDGKQFSEASDGFGQVVLTLCKTIRNYKSGLPNLEIIEVPRDKSQWNGHFELRNQETKFRETVFSKPTRSTIKRAEREISKLFQSSKKEDTE